MTYQKRLFLHLHDAQPSNCCRLRGFSNLRNFIGTANFLARSVALFDNMGMKHSNYANHFQMYVDYTRSSGFSGDGHTYTNSGYQAVCVDKRPGYEASLCGAKVVNFLLLPMHAVQQSCSYQKCCLGKLQIVGSGLSKPHTSKLN